MHRHLCVERQPDPPRCACALKSQSVNIQFDSVVSGADETGPQARHALPVLDVDVPALCARDGPKKPGRGSSGAPKSHPQPRTTTTLRR